MLQYCLGLVLLDGFGHHVEDGVHHSSTELEIKVRFDTLLRDSLGDALAIPALELPSQKIAEPRKLK
jgi:hypothetical protein